MLAARKRKRTPRLKARADEFDSDSSESDSEESAGSPTETTPESETGAAPLHKVRRVPHVEGNFAAWVYVDCSAGAVQLRAATARVRGSAFGRL